VLDWTATNINLQHQQVCRFYQLHWDFFHSHNTQMLHVVTIEKALNMTDKTYVKPFSEFYDSSRVTVVRYFV
jgi:hypothetical protein